MAKKHSSDVLVGSRRPFLKTGGAVAAAALVTSATGHARAADELLPLPSNPVTSTAMPTRNLGTLGYRC